MTADRCLVPLLQRRKTAQEGKSTHANASTNTTHEQLSDSCILPCVSVQISFWYAKHLRHNTVYISQEQTYTYSMVFRCSYQRESSFVVLPGVKGSSTPQMTNRHNQLSRDPSSCIHTYYSRTNTNIKQSRATGLYRHTHFLENTHIRTRIQFYSHNCTHCQHSLSSHQQILCVISKEFYL